MLNLLNAAEPVKLKTRFNATGITPAGSRSLPVPCSPGSCAARRLNTFDEHWEQRYSPSHQFIPNRNAHSKGRFMEGVLAQTPTPAPHDYRPRPDVSLIMPCYNEEEVLGYTIPEFAVRLRKRRRSTRTDRCGQRIGRPHRRNHS